MRFLLLILSSFVYADTYIHTSKEKYFEIKDKYPHLFSGNTAHSGIYCMSTKINYDKCLTDFNDFVKTLKTNN